MTPNIMELIFTKLLTAAQLPSGESVGRGKPRFFFKETWVDSSYKLVVVLFDWVD